MIHDSTVTYQEYHEKIIKGFKGGAASAGIYRCNTPGCECREMYRHGVYQRYVVSISNLEDFGPNMCFEEQEDFLKRMVLTTESIYILRLKCKCCGATNVILPADIVPFRSFTLPLILIILYSFYRNHFHHLVSEKHVSQFDIFSKKGISWNLIHMYLRIYAEHNKLVQEVLCIEGFLPVNASISELLQINLLLQSENISHAGVRYLLHVRQSLMYHQRKSRRFHYSIIIK